jgi:mannan endo-1,4-beta-mannosidase
MLTSLLRSFKPVQRCKKIAVLACVVLIHTSCSQTPTVKTDNCQDAAFVTVEQTQFKRAGKPYYVIGANMWYAAYLGVPEQEHLRVRLTQELDMLASYGINNLRILGAGEQSTLTRAVDTTIIKSPNEYNESLLQGMDFLLAEMAKRQMTAVIYLNNFWQWSGGMSQYMAWVENSQVFDPDATGRWDDFMQNSARFYSSPAAQTIYQSYITSLLKRTNTVTGKAYSCDSTIMAWQLANEPRPGSDKGGAINVEAYTNWLKTSAQFIHQLAPHHLVSSGSEGIMGSLRKDTIYKNAHRIAELDYLTFHMWAKNWQWFDPNKPMSLFSAQATARNFVLEHIQLAENLKKPLVLEEFGLDRDLGDFSPNSSTQQRDTYYKGVLTQLTQQAQLGKPIAGFNFWAWGGLGRSNRLDYIWQKGDDFTGDPPQEPQGLNSVFSSDQSTLEIIKEAASKFSPAP